MSVKEMELVWDRHLLTLSELFNALYRDSMLVDVTLSCQGGFLRAHKLVLSACSPYFRQVFEENPCKHPTIVLRSVDYTDMAKLLEYMYRGRMNVTADHLEGILQVAIDLKIKGFESYRTANGDSVVRNVPEISSPMQPNVNRDNRFKGQKCLNVECYKDLEDTQKNNPFSHAFTLAVHNSPLAVENKIKKENGVVAEHEGMSTSENEEEDDEEKNKEMETANKIVTLFECDICTRRFKSRKDLQKHKKIHQDKTFSCEFCSKLFSRASHLIRHRRVHTGERPFVCEVCGKDFARQDKLKLHVRTNHGNDESRETNLEINIGTVEKNFIIKEEEVDSENEVADHITLENLVPVPTNTPHPLAKEKRGRGRPRKYPICELTLPAPKRKRDFIKQEGHDDQYDITSLPYGDLSYLTMPLEQTMSLEPLVEINTESSTETEKNPLETAAKSNPVTNKETPPEPEPPTEKMEPPQTMGIIGECTVTINSNNNS